MCRRSKYKWTVYLDENERILNPPNETQYPEIKMNKSMRTEILPEPSYSYSTTCGFS